MQKFCIRMPETRQYKLKVLQKKYIMLSVNLIFSPTLKQTTWARDEELEEHKISDIVTIL